MWTRWARQRRLKDHPETIAATQQSRVYHATVAVGINLRRTRTFRRIAAHAGPSKTDTQRAVSMLEAGTGHSLSVSIRRRRHEAAELALGQFREGERRAVLEIRADDLHADRQARIAQADGHRACGQARQRRERDPERLLGIP